MSENVSTAAIVAAIERDPEAARAIREALQRAPRAPKREVPMQSYDERGNVYDPLRAEASRKREAATIAAMNAAVDSTGRTPSGWAEMPKEEADS